MEQIDERGLSRPTHPPRWVRRAIPIVGVSWLVLLLGFGSYYLLDQRSQHGPPKQTLMMQQILKAEEAVRADPSDVVARISIADLYSEAGSYQEAAEQYQEALKLDGKDLPAANGLAFAYVQLKQGEKAVPILEKAIADNQDLKVMRTSGDMAEAHLRLGQIFLAQGRVDDARAQAEEALKISPADADTLLLLGQTRARDGDLQGAVEQYKKALRMVPKFPEAYEALAAAYEGTGDRPRAAYARAMVTYSRGDYSAAAGELEKLVRSSPQVAEAHLGLGMALERVGKPDEAASQYRETLRLDPQLDYAKARLAALGEN